MRFLDLISGLAKPETGALNPVISGISSDSRMIGPGWLFAALPGLREDGAIYCERAARCGAHAFLLDHRHRHTALFPNHRDGTGTNIAIARCEGNIRSIYARAASRFHGPGPERIAMITGTAGKTSTAWFAAQIWAMLGRKAGFIGTTGAWSRNPSSPARAEPAETIELTTPEPGQLHRLLSGFRSRNITRLAMEASSHGIAMHRLDGIRPDLAAFTNLGRDHLDFHGDMDTYYQAKLRLFSDLLPDDGVVVLDSRQNGAHGVLDICRRRGLCMHDIAAITWLETEQKPEGWLVRAHPDDGKGPFALSLNLPGRFQLDNALLAAFLVIADGADARAVFATLPTLTPPPGRLSEVGTTKSGGRVFVDYAHKPDSLRALLTTMRQFCEGRLFVLFGCGGDRDSGKRPIMGKIAAELADCCFITDDNPRFEDPARIRAEIINGMGPAPGRGELWEMGDRRAAIHSAIEKLGRNDLLVIAGKGHETTMVIGTRTEPFDDIETSRAALAANRKEAAP